MNLRNVSAATNASVSFGVIPPEHWYQPEWIDEDRAREGRKRLKNTLYGGEPSIRAVVT
jgi:alpha 1,2-mannosyltransferase